MSSDECLFYRDKVHPKIVKFCANPENIGTACTERNCPLRVEERVCRWKWISEEEYWSASCGGWSNFNLDYKFCPEFGRRIEREGE